MMNNVVLFLTGFRKMILRSNIKISYANGSKELDAPFSNRLSSFHG